jgi:glucose-1-phosphate thymidylyltransferase
MIKAIIPVAGVGTMLRPHTHTQPKPLIPVAGKPILGHIIDALISAGVKDFVFVIGYLGEKIESYVRSTYEPQIKMEFVVQEPRMGLGHAIWTARNKFASCHEVLIMLGDTILDVSLKDVLHTPHSVVGVQEVDDPRKFGVVVEDEGGWVASVAEKPKIPKSNLALVGLYKIREVPQLVQALEKLVSGPKSEKGEYHLTDALMTLVQEGSKIKTLRVDNWFDCGKKETLIETNRTLLERITDLPEYHFEDSVIRHPVYLGAGCQISGSIIGPYVAIGENAIIKNSIVTNSILGAYSTLQSIILDGSVVGSDASLRGKSTSINIGENTEIDFNE